MPADLLTLLRHAALLALDHLRDNALPAAVLAAFVTCIAYIHNPRLKTLVFSLPIPFTCAYISTKINAGLEVGPTHVAGLVLATIYHWLVYLIARRWGGSLATAIGVAVAFYVGSAAAVTALLRPAERVPFAALAAGVFVLWLAGVALYRPAHEPGHRSAAPWWIKSPIIFTIALGIFGLTRLLGGAVTTFPYAGVFTSYEMRHSLRTLAGQYTINNLSFFLMFLTIRALEQRHAAQPWPLLAGWAVMGATLALIYRLGFGRPAEPVPVGE